MDGTIIYATAESEPLPVDLGAGAQCGSLPPTACLFLSVSHATS